MTTQVDGKIYNIAIQAYIQQVTTAVKFPCVFFIQWRTNDQKSSTQTAKHSPQGEKVLFDQSITLKTNIIYDKQKKVFCKKESQLQLNLISKSRPDQPKLVGRLTLDLATLLNQNPYPNLIQLPLNFCSVNAFIVLSFKIIEKIETDISVYEHQKSMSEGLSFASSIKVSTPNFGQQKHKQNGSIMKESFQLYNKINEAVANKKQYSVSMAFPRSNEQSAFKIENGVSQIKQTPPTTTVKDIRHILDQKSKSRSFKTAKSEDQPIFESRKIGSIISEIDKQQTSRIKAQLQSLKLQSGKKLQQQQRNRFELQKKVKESQFIKLQLRQKQGLIDQANAQINSLKNQNARLREENVKVKDESVKLTLKLSEIRDSSNKSQQQLLAVERQLKRYQSMSQDLSNTNQAKKQLTTQVLILQKQLGQSQKMVNSLVRQKHQLEELINLKQADYRKNYEQWRSQKAAQSSSKQNMLIQLSNAEEKCKYQSNLRVILENKVNQLQIEINRLTQISNEFLQAKNSWQITEGTLKDEINYKATRITELQETVISSGDKIRWLEGEIQLMGESIKQSKQQYLRLQEEKNNQKGQLIAEIQKMAEFIRQLNETILKVQGQKNEHINNINTLIQKYDQLNKQYEAQINQSASLFQSYQQVSKSLNEYRQRCAEFEQLLLSSNQMREKQSIQNAQKQKNMYIRIVQLENQYRHANDHILMVQGRIEMLESELKNREDLVSKLQMGLQKQIERSEDLNIKLLGYMQRAEKMKDLMVMMEEEQRRITRMIAEQELSQSRNRERIQEKQRSIMQLLNNLQQSINHGKELEETLSIRETQYRVQIDFLNLKLDESNAKAQKLQETLKNKEGYIILIETNLDENSKLLAEKDEQAQKAQLTYNQNIQFLRQSKLELESHILDLQSEISRLNQVLIHKDVQINQKIQRSNQISEQLFVKETQIGVQSAKLQQLYRTIGQLQNQINDFKNQLLLKQELIQQQTNRYNQLATQYEELQQDQRSFDIKQHNQTLKERNYTIQILQEKIKQLQKENNKISALERSVKIKTIQLNSMKFKGKGQPAESNQLLKLKDQEIASLIAEKQKLTVFQTQCAQLQEKIVALQGELELIEQEKFNIQSESNEKALILEEAREENRKLMQEITIIGQKNSELQRIIAQLTPNENGLRSTNIQINFRPQKHLIIISDKKIKQEDLNSINLCNTLNLLKQILDQRVKGRLSDKLLQMFDKISGKQAIKDSFVPVKLKTLSKDFVKLKILLLKVLQTKTGPQKTKFIDQIKNCQNLLSSVIDILE